MEQATKKNCEISILGNFERKVRQTVGLVMDEPALNRGLD